MARNRRSSKQVTTPSEEGTEELVEVSPSHHDVPVVPGEVVIYFPEGAEATLLEQVRKMLGKRPILRPTDFLERTSITEAVESGNLVVLSQLRVALARVNAAEFQKLERLTAGGAWESPDRVERNTPQAATESPIPTATQEKEPEMFNYLRGYRDAVNDLAGSFGPAPAGREEVDSSATSKSEFRDDARGTWGLHATGVLNSRYTGRGVRVAALVDGLDMSHPDWVGRRVVMKSFVGGDSPSDGGGSGTHYLGTAFGTAHPSIGPRYGCAPDAEVFMAKVLNRAGTGSRNAILAGLEWALSNDCRVILLPLGWNSPSPDLIFERVAARVAARGGLLVAGTGLNANRSHGDHGLVIHPAACPSVMAAGSIDASLKLPNWTPRGSPLPGGNVDLVGPGVNLRSSAPRPQFYTTWSGSSTAAAFVAGIAALWAESLPNASASELWQEVVSHVRPLSFSASDVGAGLVQAP